MKKRFIYIIDKSKVYTVSNVEIRALSTKYSNVVRDILCLDRYDYKDKLCDLNKQGFKQENVSGFYKYF